MDFELKKQYHLTLLEFCVFEYLRMKNRQNIRLDFSHQKIANHLGCSLKGVKNAFKKLEAKNLLSIERFVNKRLVHLIDSSSIHQDDKDDFLIPQETSQINHQSGHHSSTKTTFHQDDIDSKGDKEDQKNPLYNNKKKNNKNSFILKIYDWQEHYRKKVSHELHQFYESTPANSDILKDIEFLWQKSQSLCAQAGYDLNEEAIVKILTHKGELLKQYPLIYKTFWKYYRLEHLINETTGLKNLQSLEKPLSYDPWYRWYWVNQLSREKGKRSSFDTNEGHFNETQKGKRSSFDTNEGHFNPHRLKVLSQRHQLYIGGNQ